MVIWCNYDCWCQASIMRSSLRSLQTSRWRLPEATDHYRLPIDTQAAGDIRTTLMQSMANTFSVSWELGKRRIDDACYVSKPLSSKYHLASLLYKAKRQYILTCKINRYCISVLHQSTALCNPTSSIFNEMCALLFTWKAEKLPESPNVFLQLWHVALHFKVAIIIAIYTRHHHDPATK